MDEIAALRQKVKDLECQLESKDLEIDELTETIDQLSIEREWLTAKIGQEGY